MSENQTICFCAHASKILVTCKQGGLNKEMDNVSNITVSWSDLITSVSTESITDNPSAGCVTSVT